MDELKRHPVAIALIGFLIVIKFVLLPIFDWQNDLISNIQLTERRLAKTKVLTDMSHLLKKDYNDLLAQEHKLYSLYYSVDDMGELQRKLQRDIESQLKETGIKISSIGWNTSIVSNDAPITLMYINYRVEGKAEDVVNHILKLSLMDKPPVIETLNLVFQRSEIGKLKRLNARISLSFSVMNEELKTLSQQEVLNVSE